MVIREEITGDEDAIHDLTAIAFEPVQMSDGSEPFIIDQLRRDGDLALSLVALDHDVIIGHVAFSPVVVSGAGGDWFGLGPIAVEPERQRSGVGSRLIHEGLDTLRLKGAAGCVLIGDPAYYNRFGFQSGGELTYQDIPTQYVQWLSFKGQPARGDLRYSSAFQR